MSPLIASSSTCSAITTSRNSCASQSNQATVAVEKPPIPVRRAAVICRSLHQLFSCWTTSSPISNTSTNCLPCSVRAISLDLICSSFGDPESLLVSYAHRTRRDPGQPLVRPSALCPLQVHLQLAQDGQMLACLQQVERRDERCSSVGADGAAYAAEQALATIAGGGRDQHRVRVQHGVAERDEPRVHGFHLGVQVTGAWFKAD